MYPKTLDCCVPLKTPSFSFFGWSVIAILGWMNAVTEALESSCTLSAAAVSTDLCNVIADMLKGPKSINILVVCLDALCKQTGIFPQEGFCCDPGRLWVFENKTVVQQMISCSHNSSQTQCYSTRGRYHVCVFFLFGCLCSLFERTPVSMVKI